MPTTTSRKDKGPSVHGVVDVWQVIAPELTRSYVLRPVNDPGHLKRLFWVDGKAEYYELHVSEIKEFKEDGTVDRGDEVVLIDFQCPDECVGQIMDRLMIEISKGNVALVDDPAIYGMAIEELVSAEANR